MNSVTTTQSAESEKQAEQIKSHPLLNRASPYLAPILLSDTTLANSALAITKSCGEDDSTCQIFHLYRYIVENYDYLSDPEGEEKIRTVAQTINHGGGDCEDLSILLNSYLEQLNIPTYLVLSDDHAYTLACGVDTTSLSEFVREQFLEQLKEKLGKEQPLEVYEHANFIYLKDDSYSRSFTMKPGEAFYYGGDGSDFEEPFEMLDIAFSITARYPVSVFVLPSKEDFRKFSEDRPFSYYPECRRENITFEKNECKGLGQSGGILIVNPTMQPNNIQVSYEFSYLLSQTLLSELVANKKMSYYTIDNQQCIVLDPTAGVYGYPGYDGNVTGEKYAVNVRTKEVVELI